MSVDQGALPAWVGVDLGDDGYRVAQVTRLVEGAPVPAETAAQRHQQYLQWWTNSEALAYYELLKQRFKAQIKVPRPDASRTAEG